MVGPAIVFVFAVGRWPALEATFTGWSGLFVLLYVATMILANVQLARFACPRCGKRFNARWRDGADLRADAGKACGHCDLRLYG